MCFQICFFGEFDQCCCDVSPAGVVFSVDPGSIYVNSVQLAVGSSKSMSDSVDR